MDIFHGDAKANRNRHFNSFPFFETALRGRYEPGLVPLTMLQLIFLCFDSLDFEQHVFFVNSMNMCKQYAQYYCEAMMLRQICREDKQTVRYKQNTFFFCESWGQYIFHLFGGWELLRLHLPITSKTNSETPFLLGTKGMSFRVSWLFGLRIWEIIVPSSGQEKMMQATSSNNFKLQGLYPTVLTVLSCCFKEWVTLTHWDSSPVHGRKGRIPCLSIFVEDGSNCTLHDKPP